MAAAACPRVDRVPSLPSVAASPEPPPLWPGGWLRWAHQARLYCAAEEFGMLSSPAGLSLPLPLTFSHSVSIMLARRSQTVLSAVLTATVWLHSFQRCLEEPGANAARSSTQSSKEACLWQMEWGRFSAEQTCHMIRLTLIISLISHSKVQAWTDSAQRGQGGSCSQMSPARRKQQLLPGPVCKHHYLETMWCSFIKIRLCFDPLYSRSADDCRFSIKPCHLTEWELDKDPESWLKPINNNREKHTESSR